MINILEKQNEEWYLNRLIAQRVTYTKVKNIRIAKGVVLILALFAEVSNFTSLSFIKNIPSPWISIVVTILILIGLILDSWSNKTQEKAAKIQQEFDCKLFDIPYHSYLIDDINEIVTNAERKDPTIREQVRNWYTSEIGRFSYPYSALACQQQNIGWNRSLSKKYLRLLRYVFGVSLLVIIASSFIFIRDWKEYDLNEYWSFGNIVYLLIGPIASKFFSMKKQVREQTEFLEKENPIFDEINSNDLNRIPDILHRIQDKIFEFRKNHKPIPDMFYRYHRWSEETNSRNRLIR